MDKQQDTDLTHDAVKDEAAQAAWNWLIKQFDSAEGLDESSEAEFQRWLAEDPLHLAVYDKALGIWTAARCLASEQEKGKRR